jgi:hypothetical protein
MYLTTGGALFGQGHNSAAAPNIEILKLHWQKQVRLPRNFDPSIIPTGTSFNDPTSMTSVSTASADEKIRSTVRINPTGVFPSTPGRLPVYYVYSLKFKNSGKPIEGLAWDYLFLAPNTNTEIGRHQFVSYRTVSTGKAVTLQAQLRSPPIRVFRPSESTQTSHPKFRERAVVQCVLYADDTMWKRSDARDGVCEFLKQGKPLPKRKGGHK